jgi:WD40 repeat protein
VNEAAHVMPARDVHYNPKRPHALVTCGDGCKIKFWDTRSMVEPLLEFSGHTHWVWQARYNPFHDQLVLVRRPGALPVCCCLCAAACVHLCP